jgi:hypothetical protein
VSYHRKRYLRPHVVFQVQVFVGCHVILSDFEYVKRMAETKVMGFGRSTQVDLRKSIAYALESLVSQLVLLFVDAALDNGYDRAWVEAQWFACQQ